MLPGIIDLTENNDFQGRPSDLTIPETRNQDVEFEDCITEEEYQNLVWWESLFGKKRTPSARGILLPRPGYDTPYESRIPWEGYMNYNTIQLYGYSRIPWRCEFRLAQALDDKGFNLFNRR